MELRIKQKYVKRITGRELQYENVCCEEMANLLEDINHVLIGCTEPDKQKKCLAKLDLLLEANYCMYCGDKFTFGIIMEDKTEIQQKSKNDKNFKIVTSDAVSPNYFVLDNGEKKSAFKI